MNHNMQWNIRVYSHFLHHLDYGNFMLKLFLRISYFVAIVNEFSFALYVYKDGNDIMLGFFFYFYFMTQLNKHWDFPSPPH